MSCGSLACGAVKSVGIRPSLLLAAAKGMVLPLSVREASLAMPGPLSTSTIS